MFSSLFFQRLCFASQVGQCERPGTTLLSYAGNEISLCSKQVRTLVQRELVSTLQHFDALLSPVAPTAAYRIGEVADDPLAMYKGDLMTVNLNLAGEQSLLSQCE